MGIDKYTYSAGDGDWEDTFGARVEKQSKGYNGVSLTDYGLASLSDIMSGGAYEQAGSVYLVTSQTTITGSVATGINYILSTGATETATVSWTQTAPEWRGDYNGYYASSASNVRALGGLYFDGSDYSNKWIYYHRDCGPKTYWLQVSMVGYVSSTSITIQGTNIVFNVTASSESALLPIMLPDGIMVNSLNSSCSVYNEGTVNISLEEHTGTQMALNEHGSAATATDSTITNPEIENQDHGYYVKLEAVTTRSATIDRIRLNVTDFRIRRMVV